MSYRPVLAATFVTVTAISIAFYWGYYGLRRKKKSSQEAYSNLVGKTPLVKLFHASKLLQSDILIKVTLNKTRCGTGKDRAAKFMLERFHEDGLLSEGGLVVEGTSGSTGIALAGLCNAMGYRLLVVMPDDQAIEKKQLLERLGAVVEVVPCCAISNPEHYVNKARRLASELGGVFVNQFENQANWEAHFLQTGPEIWTDSGGVIDAFVMSAGTGGTIAGVSRYLKSKRPSIEVVLADPVGSSLHTRVTAGVCYTDQQAERSVRKHRYDSIVEGVGLDRVTSNFEKALIDSSERVSDQEALDMAHWILHTEGLFIGSSSAINVVAACRVARRLGPGRTVVTVVCDSGYRHLSRFWNPEYVSKYGLKWPLSAVSPSLEALKVEPCHQDISASCPLPLCLRS